jgi:16S rRNA (adenine1518-N6/adenine1519-N6)-dimethyltransferase
LGRIAAAAVPGDPCGVVEIGPGRGALTERLLERAEHIYAVEVDSVLVHYLQQKFREWTKLTILNADILKTDLAQWGRIAVAGNLPYYITSPIVEKVLGLGSLLERAVFLVQKEVAERLTTGPGSRDYGYLTVQTALFAEARILFTVPPGAFHPPPKVDSAVVLLEPRPRPLVADAAGFLRFASVCFRQKRKTLRNNLAADYPREALDTLPEASKRAEQLSLAELASLYERLRLLQ